MVLSFVYILDVLCEEFFLPVWCEFSIWNKLLAIK